MKPSQLFGVLVRTAGFLIVLYGLWELWGGVENVVSNLFSSDTDSQTSSLSYFADGIPELIVGSLVFFLADLIVRLAYGKSDT